jgi:hypothetical protein
MVSSEGGVFSGADLLGTPTSLFLTQVGASALIP